MRGATPRSMAPDDLAALDWRPVIARDKPGHRATPQTVQPDRVQERLLPHELRETAPGVWRLDFGRVVTGWLEADFEELLPRRARRDRVQRRDGARREPRRPAAARHLHRLRRPQRRTLHQQVQPPRLPLRRGARTDADAPPGGFPGAGDPHRLPSGSGVRLVGRRPERHPRHDRPHAGVSGLQRLHGRLPPSRTRGIRRRRQPSTEILQTLYGVAPLYANWVQAWDDAMRPGGSLPHVAPQRRGGRRRPLLVRFPGHGPVADVAQLRRPLARRAALPRHAGVDRLRRAAHARRPADPMARHPPTGTGSSATGSRRGASIRATKPPYRW